MTQTHRTVLILAAVLVLAAGLRLPRLAERPMHGDEANQAYRAGVLLDRGVYEYDPHEHHGPTLYYFALPLLWLSGAADFTETTEFPYRLEIVLFGLGLLALLWLLRDAMGPGALFWAGMLGALSPILVFYARYFIQETLLIFFAFAAIGCGWRYYRGGRWGWAALAGLSLGLVHATKETSVLIFAAMCAGLLSCLLIAWRRGELKAEAFRGRLLPHACIALAAMIVMCLVLYTSFFMHWRGPLDSVLAYATYFGRAEGTGSAGLHDKPWHYYLGMLLYSHREAGPVWSEAFILVCGLGGAIWAIAGARRAATDDWAGADYFRLFLAVYTLVLLVAYSLIPYKTPWNALVFWHPLTLLGGMAIAGAAARLRTRAVRMIFLGVCVVALGHLARLAYYTNFVYAADTRNPYVYAHTSTAVMRLMDRLGGLASVAGGPDKLQVRVLAQGGDYWPLPWYLRAYPDTGYWGVLPEPLPEGDFFITGAGLAEQVYERLGGEYVSENHGLRPNARLVVFIRGDLWSRYMATRGGG